MTHTCRFCGGPLGTVFADLGLTPLANSYVEPERVAQGEVFLPLKALVCDDCLLVQLEAYETPENIFSDYAYFSSYSKSWLEHAARYCEMARSRFGLTAGSQVVEIASNDGYLLQNFKGWGIPVFGVEPAANVAETAVAKGIPTRVVFFGADSARDLVRDGVVADLLIGNNVLAHVPDLNDFVSGLKILLGPSGAITMEFPHLLQLMLERQFDTIYHEHFSYFSLAVVQKVFAHHGLEIFDVEELPTHGGSLRIYACHPGAHAPVRDHLDAVLAKEDAAGLGQLETYRRFEREVQVVKRDLVRFLLEQQEQGKVVVGYGAPAKGNTLLNYCGAGPDVLPFTVDLSPHKQDRLLPGTRIPISAPAEIARTRPDYVLILPWNLRDEISQQMAQIREWDGKFVVAVPALEVF
jgi:SAM-dependent methyltransferase